MKPRKRKACYSAFILFCASITLAACDSNDSADEESGENPVVDDPLARGVDLALFADGALATSEIVDCELSDGTQTQCYELVTTAQNKVTDQIGPFCPRSTSDTADDAGVWLDGTTLYEADGDFILNLPNIYSSTYPPADQWILYNDDGSVNVTDTLEGCQAAARPDVDPDFQSFCVECNLEEVRAASDTDLVLSFLIPVTPVVAESNGDLAGTAGISLSGFQIAAAAPVQDILSNWTIAAFDDCGGHVNPNDGYHFHSATAREGCNSHGADADGHPSIIGYAMDGYAIHGPLTANDQEIDNLDECLGNEDDDHGYHYHAASAEKNQHIACNHGLTVAVAGDGGGGPDFTETAASLSALTGMTITTDDVEASLGDDGPPDCDDIASAAESFGVTTEQLVMASLPIPPGLECDFF